MIWQKKTELLRSDLEVKLLPNILQMLKSIEVRSMSLRIGGYKWAGRQKSLRDKNIIKYIGADKLRVLMVELFFLFNLILFFWQCILYSKLLELREINTVKSQFSINVHFLEWSAFQPNTFKPDFVWEGPPEISSCTWPAPRIIAFFNFCFSSLETCIFETWGICN